MKARQWSRCPQLRNRVTCEARVLARTGSVPGDLQTRGDGVLIALLLIVALVWYFPEMVKMCVEGK